MDGLSAKISIKVDKFSHLGKAIEEATRKAVRETMEEAAEIARSLAPVDTGALKDSIEVTTQGNQYGASATITVGVPYAIFQELGTRYMAPHPFITPAMDAVSERYQQKIADAYYEAARDCLSEPKEIG